MHWGGAKGKVTVFKVVTEVEVAVAVTKVWITIDTEVVAVSVPDVPVTGIEVVVEGVALETATESEEVVLPGGVTGLGLNPPVIPDGRIAERVTGELKPPVAKTVTLIVAVPPGLSTRLLGLAERLKTGVPVTVKIPLADDPVLPIAKIV